MKQTKYSKIADIVDNLLKCLLAVSIGLLVMCIYTQIIEPAYMSTVGSCSFNGIAYINSKGYNLSGYFDPSNQSIVILANDSKEHVEAVNYHEECHHNEYLKGRLWGCEYPIFRYMSEFECYSKDFLRELLSS